MSIFDLSGRTAVITGGNGGIGLGMAKGLAAAGATVRRAASEPCAAPLVRSAARETGPAARVGAALLER